MGASHNTYAADHDPHFFRRSPRASVKRFELFFSSPQSTKAPLCHNRKSGLVREISVPNRPASPRAAGSLAGGPRSVHGLKPPGPARTLSLRPGPARLAWGCPNLLGAPILLGCPSLLGCPGLSGYLGYSIR